MAYKTQLSDDCLGILRIGSGVVTGRELAAASVAATQLVQNTENFEYEFVDLSEVTEVRVTREELAQIVTQDRIIARFRPHAIVVIVAPQDQTLTMAREWEESVSDLGWSTHICRSRSEGLNWLRENVAALQAGR